MGYITRTFEVLLSIYIISWMDRLIHTPSLGLQDSQWGLRPGLWLAGVVDGGVIVSSKYRLGDN